MRKQLACAAALGAFAFLAQAQQTSANSANRLQAADSNFAAKAAPGGIAEVKMGELAKDHASNAAVKEFGQRMVDDHTKVNDELKIIAGRKSITLPAEMGAAEQAAYDRLSKLNGAAFDRAYMADMVKDHRADITEFRRESEHGADPDLKAFAAKTLPTLEEHLRKAEEAQRQLKK